MKIQSIGKRGYMIAFRGLMGPEDSSLTNIYLINTESTLFACDTYLGKGSMERLAKELPEVFTKPVVVINSHFHWDHVWGNCAFPDADIIAHRLCREEMLRSSIDDLKRLNTLAMGEVEIRYPNVIFDQCIEYADLGIQIFHTPGHTPDSISVYDQQDRVLFASDNVELPIPSYLDYSQLETYITTMESYISLDVEYVIPGHGEIMTRQDLRSNLQYLQDIRDGNDEKYMQEPYRTNHLSNIRHRS